MRNSVKNLRTAEEIARINAKTSKMTLAQAKAYLGSELEKRQSQINEKLYQEQDVEHFMLQYVKELLFLINNQMQAPTAIHSRDRFRMQTKVAKKVYRNSLTPLPRIVLWSVEETANYGKRISMSGIEGSTYVTKSRNTNYNPLKH